MIAIAFLMLADPAPVVLETVGPAHARKLAGQRITVTIDVGKPTYTWRGRTVVGSADGADKVEGA